MSEVFLTNEFDQRIITLGAALSAGELWQLANGVAGWFPELDAKSSGDEASFRKFSEVTGPKTTGMAFLDGQDVYWDHSANKFIDWPALNDRDFWCGTSKGDWGSSAIQMAVNLNERPSYIIDSRSSGFLHVPVGTANAPNLRQVGGWHKLTLSAASEAQKIDLLSMLGFSLTSNWIAEFFVNVIDDGASAAVDFNVGVANETHASDADSIAESAFFHLDGNDLNLFAESDDGTTEVAATDTTFDIALGTIFRCTLDGRDHTNVKYYVNGAEYLSGTANLGNIAAAVGPLKLLAHLEKTAATDTADYYVSMRVRTMEQ